MVDIKVLAGIEEYIGETLIFEQAGKNGLLNDKKLYSFKGINIGSC